MFLDPTVILAPRPDVIATDLESELILLDAGTGEMFSLNATGRAVWRALDGGTTVAGVVAAVERAYDIAADRAEADVHALLVRLLEVRLVELRGDALADGPAGEHARGHGQGGGADGPTARRVDDVGDGRGA
ncbi:MAG TPA: PqqD family protein [Longimicrobiales bacterium]